MHAYAQATPDRAPTVKPAVNSSQLQCGVSGGEGRSGVRVSRNDSWARAQAQRTRAAASKSISAASPSGASFALSPRCLCLLLCLPPPTHARHVLQHTHTHPCADCRGSRCTDRPLSVFTPSLGAVWKLALP